LAALKESENKLAMQKEETEEWRTRADVAEQRYEANESTPNSPRAENSPRSENS